MRAMLQFRVSRGQAPADVVRELRRAGARTDGAPVCVDPASGRWTVNAEVDDAARTRLADMSDVEVMSNLRVTFGVAGDY